MSGKYNNRILVLVLLVLAVILVVARFTGKNREERSLEIDLARIDTSKVTSVLLYPRAEQGRELTFMRDGNHWTVSGDGLLVPADARKITGILAGLQDLKSEQLVARSPEKWVDFQVVDSLATRIVVKEGNEPVLDLLVGRFSYQQPQGNSYNPYGRNQVTGKTYVRLNGENEVHAVEGFLAMSMNQPLNMWRDQAVARFNKQQINRIVFNYPADTGFVAEQSESGWMVAGHQADSLSMSRYLNGLSRKDARKFFDGTPPEGEPDFSLSLEGDNMEPGMIKAYATDSTVFLLHSSANPETWFTLDAGGLFNELFPGAGTLLGDQEK